MGESMHKYKNIILVIVFIGMIGAYFRLPGFRENIIAVFNILKEGNTDTIKSYIISFGVMGPIISIMLMIMQAVIAPLPAFVITFVNAYIYGWKFGTIISCIGTLIGACLCFFISRVFGRPITEKFIPSGILDRFDRIFYRYGKHVVYASRLLPFISFDGVSYAAGLTQMSFKYFFVATAVGQLPLTIVISRLGTIMDKPQQFIKYLTQCGVLAGLSMISMYIIYRRRYNGKSIKQIMDFMLIKLKQALKHI